MRTVTGFKRPYLLTDLSMDGRRAAFVRPSRTGSTLLGGVINLVHDAARFIGTVGSSPSGVQLSPNGTGLMYRHQTTLRVFHLGTGDVTVAEHGLAPAGAWWWLDDGRVAYVNRNRRVVIGRPGNEPTPTGVVIPRDTTGSSPRFFSRVLLSTLAVSADATRVLYDDARCRVRQWNRQTHATRLVGQPYVAPQRAWAPDGLHFVLTKKPDQTTGQCLRSGPPFTEFLFSRHGDRVGRVTGANDALSTGHSVTWSSDSNWILIRVEPTGTMVAGFQYLLAAFVPTRRVSRVVPDRVASDAFAGPGDRTVLSRFFFKRGASTGREDGHVIEGKLVPG